MESVLLITLDKFKSKLSDDRLRSFKLTTVRSLQECVLLIQRDQEKANEMMDFTRIHTFIKAVTQFDQVLTSFVVGNTLLFDLSACIWGPTKSIIETVKANSGAFDAILETYKKLGGFLPLMSEHQHALQEEAGWRVCLAWIYRDLIEFNLDILNLLKSPDWVKTFHVNRKDYDDKFEALLRSFDNHKTVLTIASNIQKHGPGTHITQSLGDLLQRQQQIYEEQRDYAEHQRQQRTSQLHQMSSDLQQGINDMMMRQQVNYEEIQSLILESHASLGRFIEDESKIRETLRKEDQHKDVVRWLHSPGDSNPEGQYHEEFQRIADQHPDAGKWLLEDHKIRSWMEDDIPDFSGLWVKGKKGAGKTILASRVIQYLIDNKEKHGRATSYFYCRQGNEQLTEPRVVSILKSLLTQMVNQDKVLLPTMYDKAQRGGHHLWQEQTAITLLNHFGDIDMNQFIVIDGLDELDGTDARRIVDTLGDIVKKTDDKNKPGKIRVLLFSTGLDFVEQFIGNNDRFCDFPLDPLGSAMDIQLFVSKQVNELAHSFRLDEEDLKSIKHQICGNSNGMFLYASLVAANLSQQPTTYALLDELKSPIPENYEKIYVRILDRLRTTQSKRTWEQAKEILGWLAYAKRPLKVYELEAAIATITNQDNLCVRDPKAELCHNIITMCGPLVHKIGGSRIEFSHSLAREFVLKDKSLDADAIECNLTFHCLRYLSSSYFDKNLSPESREQHAKEGQYAFQDYAMSQWPAHLQTVIRNSTDIFNRHNGQDDYATKAFMALNSFCEKRQVDPIKFKSELSHIEEEVKINAKKECASFEKFGFYQDLLRVWTHIKGNSQQASQQAAKERNQVSIKGLREVLDENREILRKLDYKLDERDQPSRDFRKFYGPYFFKCKRVNCPYFYEGFETKDDLESHLNRHERPFLCRVANCSIAQFGFSSNKDREKHYKNYHPEGGDPNEQQGEFVPLNQKVVENPKHSCEDCGKSFTRKANLDAHINSAHLGIRPYLCSTCSKPFTRKNDCKRHEKLHVRRQR